VATAEDAERVLEPGLDREVGDHHDDAPVARDAAQGGDRPCQVGAAAWRVRQPEPVERAERPDEAAAVPPRGTEEVEVA
jgi:hypothetical protein